MSSIGASPSASENEMVEYDFEHASTVEVTQERNERPFETSRGMLARPLSERITPVHGDTCSYYIVDKVLRVKTLSASKREAIIDFWESRVVKYTSDFRKAIGGTVVGAVALACLSGNPFVAALSGAVGLVLAYSIDAKGSKAADQLQLWKEFDPARKFAEKRQEAFEKGLMFVYEHRESLALHTILGRNELEGLYGEYVKQLRSSPRHQDRVTLIDEKAPNSPFNPEVINFACVSPEKQAEARELQRKCAREMAFEKGLMFVYEHRGSLALNKVLSRDELEGLYGEYVQQLKSSTRSQDRVALIDEKSPKSPLNPQIMNFACVSLERKAKVKEIQRESAREMAFEKGLMFVYEHRGSLALHKVLSRGELEGLYVEYVKQLRDSSRYHDKVKLIDEKASNSPFNPEVINFACVSSGNQKRAREVQRECAREMAFEKGLMFVYEHRGTLALQKMLSPGELERLYVEDVKQLRDSSRYQDKIALIDEKSPNSPLNPQVMNFACVSSRSQMKAKEAQRECAREMAFEKGLMFVYEHRGRLALHKLLSREDLHQLYGQQLRQYTNLLASAYSDQDKSNQFDSAASSSPILNPGIVAFACLDPLHQSQMHEVQNLYHKILDARIRAKGYFEAQIEKVRSGYRGPLDKLRQEKQERLTLVNARYDVVKKELLKQSEERKSVGAPSHMTSTEYERFCLNESRERNQTALENYTKEKKEAIHGFDEKIQNIQAEMERHITKIQKDSGSRQLSACFFPCLLALHQEVHNFYYFGQAINYSQINPSRVTLPTCSFSTPYVVTSSFSFSSSPTIPPAHILPAPPSTNPNWVPEVGVGQEAPVPSAPPLPPARDQGVSEANTSRDPSTNPNWVPEMGVGQEAPVPSAPPLPTSSNQEASDVNADWYPEKPSTQTMPEPSAPPEPIETQNSA